MSLADVAPKPLTGDGVRPLGQLRGEDARDCARLDGDVAARGVVGEQCPPACRGGDEAAELGEGAATVKV
jgi:hypothetical protein